MPAEQDDIFKLGALEKQVWCDQRLLKIIYTYNMSPQDIYGLRNVFDSILGASVMETIMNKDVFKYVGGDPDAEIPGWFISSVEPKRKKEMNFSEYVCRAHTLSACYCFSLLLLLVLLSLSYSQTLYHLSPLTSLYTLSLSPLYTTTTTTPLHRYISYVLSV